MNHHEERSLMFLNQFMAAGAVVDDDDNDWHDDRFIVDGEVKSTGLWVRDESIDPMYGVAEEFPDELLLDEHELKVCFENQLANHSMLFDLRERCGGLLDSLDQDGLGLCWAFSSTKATMYTRMLMGLVYKKLSPWFVAGVIKNWRDEGGWCTLSLHEIAKNGVPEYDLCPSYKKPSAEQFAKCRENGKKYLVTKWWEGSRDKDKLNHQKLSAYARGLCPVCDYNWLGHSMCGCGVTKFRSLQDWEELNDNSWGMKAGLRGCYQLKGSKAKSDQIIIPYVALA